MSILSIINDTTPCNFSNNDNELEIITLKYINSKYYIKNFCNYENEIKCKLIKKVKIIKSWVATSSIKVDISLYFYIVFVFFFSFVLYFLKPFIFAVNTFII
jgi:hypothetical protein